MPVPTSSSGLVYARPLGYRLVQQIGGGGFSKVFRATKLDDDRHPIAAVKVVSFAPPPPPAPSTAFDAHGNPLPAPAPVRHPVDRRALQKEVQIHAVLKHKAVLEFIGAEEYGGKARAIPSNTVPGLYIVLELAAGGDLFDKIAPDYGLEEDLAHFYFKQLLGGLEYIHQQGVVHRDIKPENLLLDAEGNVKLADFGLCSVYKYKGKEREMHGACGSLPYIAPEMNGKPYRGEPVDVWSAGVVLFALLVGNTPWDEPTKRSPEYEAYLTGELFKYDPWTRLEPETLSLLRKMLEPDPSKRLKIEQIKQHRWYKRDNRFISKADQCTDPSLLAERLLHGLMVSGDMHANLKMELHSDGKRAEVPDIISHTQPADHFARPITFGPSFPSSNDSASSSAAEWFASSRVQPPSSAAFSGTTSAAAASSYRSNHAHGLKSLSLADAEANLARLKREGPTQGGPRWAGAGAPAEEAGMSQFTQTFNLLTQWSPSLVLSSALRFSPELTRFFAKREAADVVKHLVGILQGGNTFSSSSNVRDSASGGTETSKAGLKGIQISIEGCVVQPVGGGGGASSRTGSLSSRTSTSQSDVPDADGDSQMVSTPSAASGPTTAPEDSEDGEAALPPSSSTTLVEHSPGTQSAEPALPSSATGSGLERSTSSDTLRPLGGSGNSTSTAMGSAPQLEYIVSSSGSRIRLSTMDRRKCPLRGEILVAPFRAQRHNQEDDDDESAPEAAAAAAGEQERTDDEAPRCVVLWKRSKGNPLEWRKLFRAVTADEALQAMLVRA